MKELDDGGHPVQRLVVDQYYEFTISGADITLRDIAPNPIRPSAFEEDTTALSAQVEVANGAMVYTTGAGSLRGESQVIVLEKSRSGIVIRENQIRPFGLERELFDHTFLLVDRGQQTPIEIRVRYTRQQVVRPVPGVVITAHLSAKPFTFEARQRNAVVPAYIGAAAIYQNRLVLAQTDHLWFSETGQPRQLQLRPGRGFGREQGGVGGGSHLRPNDARHRHPQHLRGDPAPPVRGGEDAVRAGWGAGAGHAGAPGGAGHRQQARHPHRGRSRQCGVHQRDGQRHSHAGLRGAQGRVRGRRPSATRGEHLVHDVVGLAPPAPGPGDRQRGAPVAWSTAAAASPCC